MANVFSSISDYLSGGQTGNALAIFGNAVTRLQNVTIPDLNAAAEQARQAMLAGQMTPAQYQAAMTQIEGKMQAAQAEVYQQGNSLMNDVNSDPETIAGARAALGQLADIGKNNGMTDADRAQYAATIGQNNADARGQITAAQNRLAAQGQGGSGASLAAELSGVQGAANRNASAGAAVATSAQARALDAIKAGLAGNAGLNSQLFAQDASKAQAQDQINQFNTAAKNTNAQYNASNEQAARMAEYARAQQVADLNAAAQNAANQTNTANQQQANQVNTQIQQNAAMLPYQANIDQYKATLERERAAANASAKYGSATAAAGNNTAQGAGQLVGAAASALGSLGGIGGIANGVKSLFGGDSSSALTGFSNVGTYGLGNSIPETAASYGSGVAGYPGGAPTTGWDGGFFSGIGDTVSGWGSSIADGVSSFFGSDEALKTNKKEMSDDEIDKLMGSLTGMKYRYKGPSTNPEVHGVMAQDLEKGGSNSVIDTPAGKMVQKPQLMSEALAILANQHKRLVELEGKKD